MNFKYLKTFESYNKFNLADESFTRLANLCFETGSVDEMKMFVDRGADLNDEEIDFNEIVMEEERFEFFMNNGGNIDNIMVNNRTKYMLESEEYQRIIIKAGFIEFLKNNNILDDSLRSEFPDQFYSLDLAI